jgi:hypothetical protein
MFQKLKKGDQNMARFDKSLDRCVKSWVIGDASDKHLEVSVYSYNGGELKMQILRKFRYKNGKQGFGKMGRLTIEETVGLADVLPEVRGIMGESISALTIG